MITTAHPKRPRPLLEAQSLRAVRRGVDILGGVSLRVYPGEFVAVLGGPHSGKSTLTRCLAGHSRSSAGGLSLAGRELASVGWPDAQAALHSVIGLVNGKDRLPLGMTLTGWVAEPLVAAGALPNVALAWARDLLGLVGLSALELLDPGPAGATQVRLSAVARAIALSPAVLIADEPTADLDAAGAHRVFAALRAASQRPGRALVLATHDPELAARADRIVVLERGRAAGRIRSEEAATG